MFSEEYCKKKYEETGDEGYLEMAKLWAKKNAGVDTRTKEEVVVVADDDDCESCKI